ncbi:phosphotransferase family protein [Subtercola lobariae]|uniref:Acyl-CoA dehydrogenase n=1 Tax=Subtercola lobariae TaxID=1588641 RepID=A0A917B4L4_9MICO|nr:phosphotransferase family protein [Subtercola lobariae]GGF21298.1 acyl-CoA dehydrogenase [Subtercola lobariae]
MSVSHPSTPDSRVRVAGLDVLGLSRWLHREHPELLADPPDTITATLIEGGRSNLTYRIEGAARPLVLRRPPLAHVLASAHDMRREYRVMAALASTAVAVPPMIDLVDDTEAGEITATPFYLMGFVDGVVLATRHDNAPFEAAELHRISLELAEVLAELHAVDPESVGLEDFGRPTGYLTRQLATWRRQHDASRSREQPALERLHDLLAERMPDPSAPRTSLVHGDYRLDNALVTRPTPLPHSHPRIAAILDWEMSTLGDALVDLGMLGLYWGISELPGAKTVMPSAVDVSAGYASFPEIIDAYAVRAGIRTPDLSWYRAFAAYKLAVIAEGIHFRYASGGTVGDGFERVGDLVAPLAEEGLRRVLSGRVSAPTHGAADAEAAAAHADGEATAALADTAPHRTPDEKD